MNSYRYLCWNRSTVLNTIRQCSFQRTCLEKISKEDNLKTIEENIILRKHKNNIPKIRSILKVLQDHSAKEEDLSNLQTELNKLPNDTHPRLEAYGENPQELKRYIFKENFRDVVEFSKICKTMNLFRMDHLGNYTGHKSYYLNGSLASLEQSLIQYALKTLQQEKFELISVPDILPRTIIEGCGMQTEGERTQVYKLDSTKCLSGTSEMALAGFFKDKILAEHELPIKVAAVSRCYRAETSNVTEEKGIYRVHHFTKVEMFAICSENQSEDTLNLFKDIEVSLFKNLELNIRLLDMPPSELGAPAYQKYDIEAWMPGRQIWGEISSCSNCTNYQAQRLNIRYRTKDNELKFVHTINGTAVAIPRLLISLIESNQNGTDEITIPTTLLPFLKQSNIKKSKKMPEIKIIKSIKSMQ